jgi:hypothetical protein
MPVGKMFDYQMAVSQKKQKKFYNNECKNVFYQSTNFKLTLCNHLTACFSRVILKYQIQSKLKDEMD